MKSAYTSRKRIAASLKVTVILTSTLVSSFWAGPIAAAEVKLTQTNGSPNEHFGSSVAMDQGTVIVGANASNNYAGHAIVFERNGSNYTEQARLAANDGLAGDWFGASVAISGDTAVIGAPNKNAEAGAVYIFTRYGNTWSQQTMLTALDGSPGDRFGNSVAIYGDTIVAGAYQQNELRGSAYVFLRISDFWKQQAKLTASDAAAGDWFGNSVSISENTIVAGAIYRDRGKGAGYVFTRIGGTWIDQGKLTLPEGAAGDQLGSGVSISGETLVLGARGKNFLKGAVFVFSRSGGEWKEQAMLAAGDGAANDRIGEAVAISENAVITGSRYKAGAAGAAYIFYRSGVVWNQRDKLVASDGTPGDYFGSCVAVSGAQVVIGAPEKSTFTGAVYAYSAVVPLNVSTFSASQVSAASATLNGGLISLGGASVVNVFFEYGLTTAYGGSTLVQPMTFTGPFSAVITGLSPETKYHFRARTDSETGPDMTFSTTLPLSTTPPPPTSTTSQITVTSTVTTTVTALATLTIKTAIPLATLPSPTTATPPPEATLPEVSITVPTRTATVAIKDAKQQSPISVILKGELKSQGPSQPASVFFEYGPSPAYGSMTPKKTLTGDGEFTSEISGLATGVIFHYRAVVESSGSTAASQDATFTLKNEGASQIRWLIPGVAILFLGLMVALGVRLVKKRGYYR